MDSNAFARRNVAPAADYRWQLALWPFEDGLVARLACIIPCTGNTEALERTLVSVLERRPDECEVLVVLTAPYDDPYKLDGEIQFIQAPAESGLIGCLNLGIAAAKAPVVHLLASGFEVDTGWIDRALAHFDDPRVAAVTPAIFEIADHGRMIAAGIGYERGGAKIICDSGADEISAPVGPMLEAAFYRRAVLEVTGGLPRGLGSARSDVDFALALRAAGWQIVADRECRIFAAAIDVAKELPELSTLERVLGRMAAIFAFGTSLRYRKVVTSLRTAALATSEQLESTKIFGGAIQSQVAAFGQRRVDSKQPIAEPAGNRIARRAKKQKNRR
jgi:hypothetical protein